MEEINPVGRPTLYTKQLGEMICALVAEGKSMATICAADAMPARSSVYLWLNQYPEFSDKYRDAYKAQMFGVYDELLTIVDQSEVDQIAKVREQIKVRQWLLKIHEPKRFGDKPEPVVVNTSGVDVSKLTNEELDQYVDLLAKMKKN